MPREDKRVIFTFDEVYRALYTHLKRVKERQIPAGTIVSVEYVDITEESLLFSIENYQDRDIDIMKREYSKAFLAAALINYCRGHQIPMPKNAEKTIKLHKDTIILRTVM